MDVKTTITQTAGKVRLGLIKKSPELALAGTIIFGGFAVVSAIKRTLDADVILQHHQIRMEAAKAVTENEDGTPSKTDKEVKQEIAKAYIQTGWEFGKHYAPTFLLFMASTGCALTGFGIMKKRNVALATTLAGVRTAFDEYRGRVVRELGAEKDEHFLYDTVDEKVERVTVDENGIETKKKEKVSKPTKLSVYSRFFDEANPNHHKDDGNANYKFLRAQLIYLQKKQIANGYLFLNDVYRQLGLPISIAGQSAGWIYDYDNREGTLINFKGFNEIDNDMYLSQAVRDLRNGYETNILLDFENVMDDILTDIPRVNTEVTAV